MSVSGVWTRAWLANKVTVYSNYWEMESAVITLNDYLVYSNVKNSPRKKPSKYIFQLFIFLASKFNLFPTSLKFLFRPN